MSTDRMDNSQSTARMDTGTARMDTGTARMDAGTARIGGSQGAGQTGGGIFFDEGQTIVLNGNNCVIENRISMGSGEAVVYKINMGKKPYVLKHYKPNTPLSDTAKKVLTKIKDNPKENIVKIIDIGNYNGQDFEIMEYAEGGTLSEFIKKNGAIQDNKLKDIIKQINEGLQQLHGYYKTIYQDLKPENIFFRDKKKTSLVLADFGISSVMKGRSEEVEVIASNTDLYAAPELSRKGNNTTVEITPAVDYFALGITMYELWLGEQPFKEMKAITRERNIRDKNVKFPANMPNNCKMLIQGLINPLPKERWKNEHVQKWLNGESFTLDSKKTSTKTSSIYKPLKFGDEFASNPKEMAELMQQNPEAGRLCLYDGFITSTLKEAGDVTLYTDINNVISQYNKDQKTGLIAAIYTLDPERPFISRTGKICETSEEIADAIMADSAHYMDELTKRNASLYTYITVTGGSQGKETANTFCNFFKKYPPNRALTLVYLKLQSDDTIPLGSKRYQSIDELAQENDRSQIDLIKRAIIEKNSPLLVWMSDKYGDEFNMQSAADQFFLLGLFPFLSFTDLSSSNGVAELQYLIDNYPERSDLFETYAAQGLPLKGHILDKPIKKTPIDYVVSNFTDLISLHDRDTIFNLIRLLQKLGADVNEYSSDGRCPFINALGKDNDLIELLRELEVNEDFVSNDGKICKSTEDIADAIMSESSYYMNELKTPNADLYLYLLAIGGAQGKEFVENFRKYFREYSPKRALAWVNVQLQKDLGITIGSKHYKSPEDLKQEKSKAQINLIKKAVMEKDSLLLGWISVHEDYFRSFKSIEAFCNLAIPDQFFLLKLMPFLSYEELKGSDWEQSAISDLHFLIDNVPGRLELFEAYAGQGLPLTLKGQIFDSSVKRTPIDYIVCSFDDLKKHGADTIYNLVRLLCKLGSDINEYSSDGTCPLINAFEAFFAGKNDLINLLLEQGANANQYREFIDRKEEQELRKYKQALLAAQKKKAEEEENDCIKAEERENQRIEDEKKKKHEKTRKKISLAVVAAVILSILGYSLYMGRFAFVFKQHIDIPDTVETINDGEFAGKQLTSINIPDSVTSIGDRAFNRNGLTSVVIPAGVTSIGKKAFANNRLTSIIIGTNVILGNGAFSSDFLDAYNNNGMAAGMYTRSGILNADWSSWHGNFGFQYNDESISIIDYNGDDRDIEIPAVIGGYPVTAIGKVFSERNLTGVTIPGTITSIENQAFRNNKLTSVNIGKGVISIGNSAFEQNMLTNIIIPDSVTIIGEQAFKENRLTSVSIGNNVTSIRAGAFQQNRLTNIIIPNSVDVIGEQAFMGNMLTDVSIGNSVTSIGISAFRYNRLTSIVIPNSMNYIGGHAFADNMVTNVRIGANAKLGNDILGPNTGFNSAYSTFANTVRRAGTYTRPNANSTSWTRR